MSRFVPTRNLASKLSGMVTPKLETVADKIAAEAKRNTPVDSGKAKDSIRVEPAGDGYRVIAGGNDAWYFSFIEYGTSALDAVAPLRRAAESNSTNFNER